MGIKFNPFTGQFDFTGSSGGGSGQTLKIEFRTITALEAASKQLTLAFSPVSEVSLSFVNGSDQYFPDDYDVIGNTIDWNGKALDGFVEEDDKVVITYAY